MQQIVTWPGMIVMLSIGPIGVWIFLTWHERQRYDPRVSRGAELGVGAMLPILGVFCFGVGTLKLLLALLF